MLVRHLVLLVFAAPLLAACAMVTVLKGGPGRFATLTESPAFPEGQPIQLLGFGVGRASGNPDDWACAVFLGTSLDKGDETALVNLSDQAFEEVIGPDCAAAVYQNSRDDKWYRVPRATVYLGPSIYLIKGASDFPEGAFLSNVQVGPGELARLRVDYRVKRQTGQPQRPETAQSVEFERVTQTAIPVRPSVREPNLTATPTAIEPGVVIQLENARDHVYSGHSKPTHMIFYRTEVPVLDAPASKALAQKAVAALASERLQRRELNGVTIGSFNEPKRSRFHFRPSYRYDTDGSGNSR